MKCKTWIIDRYSPTRKKMKIESVPAISEAEAQMIADLLPQKTWSVENLRRCPGVIKVYVADYSEQDGCDIRLDYICDVCRAHVDGLPTLDDESVGAFLQRWVDTLE